MTANPITPMSALSAMVSPRAFRGQVLCLSPAAKGGQIRGEALAESTRHALNGVMTVDEIAQKRLLLSSISGAHLATCACGRALGSRLLRRHRLFRSCLSRFVSALSRTRPHRVAAPPWIRTSGSRRELRRRVRGALAANRVFGAGDDGRSPGRRNQRRRRARRLNRFQATRLRGATRCLSPPRCWSRQFANGRPARIPADLRRLFEPPF